MIAPGPALPRRYLPWHLPYPLSFRHFGAQGRPNTVPLSVRNGAHKSTAGLLLKLGATVHGREGMDARGRLALQGAGGGDEDCAPELIDPDGNQVHP